MHHSRHSNNKSHFFTRQFRKHFIPHESNNYHPHMLRTAAFTGLTFLITLVFCFSVFQTLVIQKTGILSLIYPEALVQLLNEDRDEYDLSKLNVNPVLQKVAQAKANDMAAKGYFAHNSPEGKTPWYWFKQQGYDYEFAGENLAINFADSADANNAWMNSPTHRANILNEKFTEVGIATAKGTYKGKETIFVAQVFGTPRLAGNPQSSATLAKTDTPVQDLQTKPASGSAVAGSASAGVSKAPVTAEVAGAEDELPAPTFVAVSRPTMEADKQQMMTDTNASAKLDQNPNPEAEVRSMVNVTTEKVLTNPKRTMALAFSFIAGIILFALVAMFSVEQHRHHHKPYIYGIMLILLMLSLLIFFQSYIANNGAVAMPSQTNSDTINA